MGSTGFKKWQFFQHKTGREYGCFPSPRARKLWYYAVSIGEATWPRGMEYGHPRPGGSAYEDEGYLIHYVVRGELTHEIRARTYVVRGNEAALMHLPTGARYRNESNHPVHFWWVQFNARQMPEVFAELHADQNPIFGPFPRPIMEKLFREIIRVTKEEPRGYEAETSALLASLLAKLFAVRSPEITLVDTGKDITKASEPIRDAVHYLIRRYTDPWTVKDLSARVGMSMYHFFRTFRRETGCTPIQYLNLYRIELAKGLLAETRAPVEQIAQQVGISNQKYFSRLFHKMTGLSPRAYRESGRATKSA